MTILFVLPDRSKQYLVHNLVSDHDQVVAEVETKYIQDDMVALPPVPKSCMDVNARNTKVGSL